MYCRQAIEILMPGQRAGLFTAALDAFEIPSTRSSKKIASVRNARFVGKVRVTPDKMCISAKLVAVRPGGRAGAVGISGSRTMTDS